ncbi:RNA polymerase sigma-70 factor [Tenacibaculum holothuriorum]|uniref:RNA polymerase sigma-70 factor n=1 Tax=Tenacibaculum holothuriorum TaxID=1635173 RepID=A0A1Y2P9Y8_9FLAO|nr:sigma-70 family RNA polymerase sigma factor [Tenacibaculum holothuriorum]OSY87242.1 RNA polymerase sigma-70 factor [Tenacibaculum holothuriorum]
MTTHEVWTKYADDIKYFILSKVKDKDVTEDLLQDTFIKVHTKLHTLKDITKLKPWIFTIARNSIMDYFKSTNQTFELANFETETKIEEYKHTEKDCLRGILESLPKKYRDPLFLSDIKGLKQQEVAQQLNQSLPTTKSQIQRARKLIAKGFMDCCGFVLNEQGKLVGEIQDKDDCKVCN